MKTPMVKKIHAATQKEYFQKAAKRSAKTPLIKAIKNKKLKNNGSDDSPNSR